MWEGPGITTPTADDFARMNAVKAGETTPTIDLSDAVWLVRQLANEERVIASLRILVAAQEHFRCRQNPQNYAVTMNLLQPEIEPDLAAGRKNGYDFYPLGTADATSFAFRASPSSIMIVAGVRAFYVDQTGVIRYEESGQNGVYKPATWNSPWLP